MATEHFRPEPPSPDWTSASPKWPKLSRNITSQVLGSVIIRRPLQVTLPRSTTHVNSIQSSRQSARPANPSTMRWQSDGDDAETLVNPNPSSHLRTHRLLLVVFLPMLALCGNWRSIDLSPLSNQFFENRK